MNSISLSQLTQQIQQALRSTFDDTIWIQAEISELRENSNGHCYLELIEKDKDSDALLAKSKATIWSSTYRMLKPYFEESTGQKLVAGLKVLVAVNVEFHGVYGFGLNIRDIDPTFTIGELVARRMKIIRQLEADGVADMNKMLEIPVLPKRLAIISSATAAGYEDFSNQLQYSESKFAFHTQLFPAVMQGDAADKSIIAALDSINRHVDLFDVVVIIRGGGASTDLACFDSYELALNVAQFPLPIIAGIGHQRDLSIVDMVAHTSVKTPTAAAEFLIAKMTAAKNSLLTIAEEIESFVQNFVAGEKRKLDQSKLLIKYSLSRRTTQQAHYLFTQRNRLQNSIRTQIMVQKNRLLLLDKSIETHSPHFLLKQGYTLTTCNGKRLHSVEEIKAGDKIRTYIFDGNIESQVIKCEKDKAKR